MRSRRLPPPRRGGTARLRAARAVALGEMDGWEATTHIRANRTTAHIPVIALTAHALESDRRKSVEVGCIDFETKPVSLPELVAKIERHANGH